jgi:Cdc6-like AAA superfamily ATPase
MPGPRESASGRSRRRRRLLRQRRQGLPAVRRGAGPRAIRSGTTLGSRLLVAVTVLNARGGCPAMCSSVYSGSPSPAPVVEGSGVTDPKPGPDVGAVYRSAILSLKPDVEAKILETSKSPRFIDYAEQAKRFEEGVAAQAPEIEGRLAPARAALREELDRQPRPSYPLALRVTSLVILTTLASLTLYILPDTPAGSGSINFGKIGIGLVVTGVTIAFLVDNWRRSVQMRLVGLRRTAAENALDAEVTTVIEEFYARAVNSYLGPQGRLAFPINAPRLVELDSSSIIASRQMHYVQTFITSHESAAIGIAGSRGSGKSTIMQSLSKDRELAAAAVMLSAPVKYESAEFTRRLLLEVATKILEFEDPNDYRYSRLSVSRVTNTRVLIFLGAIFVGLVVFLVDVSKERLAIPISLVGEAGVALAAAGTVGLFISFQSRLAQGRRLSSFRSESARLADEILEWLQYETERAMSSHVKTRPLGKFVELDDSDSVKVKRRAATHLDAVAELRRLLLTFAQEDEARRFIILVDELDKLAKPQDLIDAVNTLKDLFHIQGMHFVVSVSLDALASFERRGLPSRDAFDSAFDVVIDVGYLSPRESLEVLASRSEGFPPVLGLLCHAWSGGLPRDLLRHARRCVELHRSLQDESLPTLVNLLISEELQRLLESAVRCSKEDDLAELLKIRSAIRLDDGNADFLADGGISWSQPENHAVADLVRLGAALSEYFRTRLEPTSWWTPEDAHLEVAETVAEAMRRRGDQGDLRREAFELAMEACR